MADKVERLRRLMRDGYLVDEVESEGGFMEATLRKGRLVVVLRLDAWDAKELLLDPRPLR